MDRVALGNLIRVQRRINNVSVKRLIAGVCTPRKLFRLEMGEGFADFFLLERIIERLGISLNKLDLFYMEGNIELPLKREYIHRLLMEKRYSDVERELARYERRTRKGDALNRQYIKFVRAILASEKKNNHEEARDFAKEAFELTVKNFQLYRMDEYVLGEEEIILLLFYLQEKEKTEDFRIYEYGDVILDYIYVRFDDNEVKANLISKAAWLIGESYLKFGYERHGLKSFLRGEEILTENGVLINLSQYLDKIVEVSSGVDKVINRNFRRMRDALQALYFEYDLGWNREKLQIWNSYKTNGVFSIAECIRERRSERGHSQESLAEELNLDYKTLSRIENRKVKPKQNTLKKLKEFLDLDKDMCRIRLEVEDLKLLDLEREIMRNLSFDKVEAADALYDMLRRRLPRRPAINRQYLSFIKLIIRSRKGEIDTEKMLVELIDIYKITRGQLDISELNYRIPSRLESFILNNIAVCFKNLKRYGESILVLEKIVEIYEKSVFPSVHKYPLLSVFYKNLISSYEECNRLEDSVNLSEKAIRFVLKCNRGNLLSHFIIEKTYALDRILGNRSFSKESYQTAYQLMKLMNISDKEQKVLQMTFKQWYNEKIEKH